MRRRTTGRPSRPRTSLARTNVRSDKGAIRSRRKRWAGLSRHTAGSTPPATAPYPHGAPSFRRMNSGGRPSQGRGGGPAEGRAMATGTTRSTRSSVGPGLLRNTAVPAAVVLLAVFGFSACSEIATVKNAVHAIGGNEATIDAFSTTLQSGTATSFEATYVTTGSAPATIVYAVQPPEGVAFDDTPSGGSGDTTPVHIVVNSSGEFACSQPSVPGAHRAPSGPARSWGPPMRPPRTRSSTSTRRRTGSAS